MDATATTAWTFNHEGTRLGGMTKVHRNGSLAVLKGLHVERGLAGWVFTFTSPVTGIEEIHRGFRTMAAAKAGATKYASSPVGTPIER